MLASLLLPLLLVACGSQAQDHELCIMYPELCIEEKMGVDTAGSCNCACALTAEVTTAYQTKYNVCVGRSDRQRLCSIKSGPS